MRTQKPQILSKPASSSWNFLLSTEYMCQRQERKEVEGCLGFLFLSLRKHHEEEEQVQIHGSVPVYMNSVRGFPTKPQSHHLCIVGKDNISVHVRCREGLLTLPIDP